MSRAYGYDIKSEIYTKLNSVLNTTITTIKTERSALSWISKLVNVASITKSKPTRNALPEAVVFLDQSRSIVETLGTDICNAKEVYEVNVLFTMKDNTIYQDDLLELYIEAIQRTLYGYNSSLITFIETNRTERFEDAQKNMGFKYALIVFNAIVN